jgi:hypothetical protein
VVAGVRDADHAESVNNSGTPQTPDAQVSRWLHLSAAAMLALCIATAAVLALRGISGVPAYYFYDQDAFLVVGAAAALLLAPRLLARSRRALSPLTARQVALGIIAAAAFAYAGAHVILLRYPMSRDEALAQFAADYLRRGQLGWPIPPHLQHLSRALMPVWADHWAASGYWTSSYLPVNSGFRALAALLGDTWLAGPLLLAAGLAALWHSARRLWPDTGEPATVALLLALTSSQLLVAAMSAYAMTAQFALNALWLLCFLHGGRRGHALAITIGLFATGLHQLHFHVMFISGFVLWLWLDGQRRTALYYVAACVGYLAFWQLAYGEIVLPLALGATTGKTVDPAAAAMPFLSHFSRLRELEPFSSLTRFAAWQNVLMLPLAALGITRWRPHDGPPPIALAFQISCLFGLLLMPYQAFGYGYRYLHGMMPCFLLLAAGGWMKLAKLYGRPAPGSLLIAAAAFALLATLPFTLWRSHALLAPYAASFSAARAAPADIVLMDGRGGGFLQDIVRIDDRIALPLLLDLAYVPPRTLAALCRTRRVMLFDHRQAHALGVMGNGVGDVPTYPELAAARRRDLSRWRCDVPVPLPPQR